MTTPSDAAALRSSGAGTEGLPDANDFRERLIDLRCFTNTYGPNDKIALDAEDVCDTAYRAALSRIEGLTGQLTNVQKAMHTYRREAERSRGAVREDAAIREDAATSKGVDDASSVQPPHAFNETDLREVARIAIVGESWQTKKQLSKNTLEKARRAVARFLAKRSSPATRPLRLDQADAIEAEMRALETDPDTTVPQMRLFMQSPMPCGHAVGNLLTCDSPPFGCVICGEPPAAIPKDAPDIGLSDFHAPNCGMDTDHEGPCAPNPHDDGTRPVQPPAEPRTCNRHKDCGDADRKAREAGRTYADHCHDSCCEDCFGY